MSAAAAPAASFTNPFSASATTNPDPAAPAAAAATTTGTDRRSSANSSSSETDSPSKEAIPLSQRDRRLSKEWDASLTPPSKFQRLPGSIYATPASRDGHVARNKIHGFKEKVRELSGKK